MTCNNHTCARSDAHDYVEGLGVTLCRFCFDAWRRLQVDLPLAIQELHALALIAPVVQQHGSSVFQDWWPRDIRDTQLRALDRVCQLRRLEATLKGGNT
jgi:hypothetical protein